MKTSLSTGHRRQSVRKALIISSFLLFPVTFYYLSPYLIIMGAGERTASGSAIVFGVMIVASLILGRLYCGWICPVGGLGEMLATAQGKRANNRANWTRWLVWVPWITIVLLMIIRAGGFVRADFLYQTDHGVSLTTKDNMGPYYMYYTVLGVMVALSFVAGKRGFCHHACWIAPFMMIGRGIRNGLHLPAVQLQANTPACIGCRACTTACPMSLPVQEMVQNHHMENSECILCGSCVDTCPRKVIRYNFGRPRQQGATDPTNRPSTSV
ncbi:MAG: 4Fe-4S binding protein [Candidatus Cryosericum sp.]